jgi:hypothetical protein
MEPVAQRLAEWKSIYDQLQSARKRRDAAFDSKGTAKQLDDIDAELARLQRANDDALNALYRAMSAQKA